VGSSEVGWASISASEHGEGAGRGDSKIGARPRSASSQGGGPRQQQGWATRDPPRDTNFISVALAKADWRDASDLR
jgi:hypothetical protein